MSPTGFIRSLLLVCSVFAASTSHADWRDWFRQAQKATEEFSQESNAGTETKASASFANLSKADISAGLKQALEVGAKRVVEQVGVENGFYNDAQIRIPMPEGMNKVTALMENMGQGALVQQFQLSMNRAAEQAVPKALPIFENAITSMSIEDALSILQGSEDAATAYFQTKTSASLQAEIEPLVSNAMAQSQVNLYYKNLMSTAKRYDRFGLMDIYLGANADADVETHVTQYALQGLFTKLAVEEKKIRDNPKQRSTELMKKVFSGQQQ